jgi:hypothetical protein
VPGATLLAERKKIDVNPKPKRGGNVLCGLMKAVQKLPLKGGVKTPPRATGIKKPKTKSGEVKMKTADKRREQEKRSHERPLRKPQKKQLLMLVCGGAESKNGSNERLKSRIQKLGQLPLLSGAETREGQEIEGWGASDDFLCPGTQTAVGASSETLALVEDQGV